MVETPVDDARKLKGLARALEFHLDGTRSEIKGTGDLEEVPQRSAPMQQWKAGAQFTEANRVAMVTRYHR